MLILMHMQFSSKPWDEVLDTEKGLHGYRKAVMARLHSLPEGPLWRCCICHSPHWQVAGAILAYPQSRRHTVAAGIAAELAAPFQGPSLTLPAEMHVYNTRSACASRGVLPHPC